MEGQFILWLKLGTEGRVNRRKKMNAKKCDRCGAFYERYAREAEPSDSDKIKNLLNNKRNGFMITQDIGYCSENIDLCPSVLKSS